MTIRILQGDCREALRTLEADTVDAVVTDPPYELGFMGRRWDKTGVAFDVTTWAECLRVLKPGGHLLAFSGTRTQHRMVCAIEDAGFEIRDQIGWAYGSGFPKSHNGPWGGTALKPAWEPICMARKPLDGTVEANWREHGTGALNIDGCRVGDTVETWPSSRSYSRSEPGSPTKGTQSAGAAPPGRWPANLIHDGSDEVLAAFPDAPGQLAPVRFDAEERKTGSVYGAMKRGHEPSADSANEGAVGFKMKPGARRLDTGSAARFFYCAKADRADRHAGLEDPGPQFTQGATLRDAEAVSKQAKGNHHPTVKPTDLMRYLCRLVTPAGGVVLDPFMGSGSTLKAAELEGFSAIGIELNPDYIAIARRRISADAPLFADVA